MSLSRDQVRSADRHAIEVLGVPGVVLMENAGRGAADAIEQFLAGAVPAEVGAGPRAKSAGRTQAEAPGVSQSESRGLSGKRVAIVAGAGNNGGDGFVVARHLHIRGASVAVFLVAEEAKIVGDAAVNLRIIRNLGLNIRAAAAKADGGHPAGLGAAAPSGAKSEGGARAGADPGPSGPVPMDSLAEVLRGFDLVVDAVGGTGIQGPLRGSQAAAVEQINASGVPVVALDIPTGLDCDTGAAAGPVVRAKLTVTFAARKKGFDAPGAARYTGQVLVADIGVPVEDP
jgi:hydroxyethylthiazole kinase-like uncharacterized protein yjeF